MRNDLVTTEAEILRNVVTFTNGVLTQGPEQSAFIEMVKRSVNFYPFQNGKAFDFAPSRFIGYIDNDFKNHGLLLTKLPNGRVSADGGETTVRINEVLHTEAVGDEFLQSQLIEYGKRIGTKIDGRAHKFWRLPLVEQSIHTLNSAIDDVDASGAGNDSPEYKRRMAGSYVRDPEVRRQVLLRANGICEYGGCTTFKKVSGQAYLEAHHVISLSEQGIDKLSNVIALCPNHHREAHFGQQWQSLQDEFIQILKKLAP